MAIHGESSMIMDFSWILSDRLPLPENELVALKKVVTLLRLLDYSSSSLRNNSRRRGNCCVRGSVTALICQATSSDVTEPLNESSVSLSDILLGLFIVRLSDSVIMSSTSVSVLIVFFIKWEKQN